MIITKRVRVVDEHLPSGSLIFNQEGGELIKCLYTNMKYKYILNSHDVKKKIYQTNVRS